MPLLPALGPSMFLGEFAHALDDKHRLTLPAKFRARLADGVVVTAGPGPFLLVYPLDEFKVLFDKVSALSLMDAEAAAIRRLLFSSAFDVVPDKQNRVVLPQMLREHAGLTDAAVVVGVGRFLEVWNPQTWEQVRQAVRQRTADPSVWARLGV
ncbi:MAG: division/cell wall cluster transcriptional repressor MraZ [Thermoflexales bacterium]|nr:division/cell wall cluster transcriptional repressor MraZ [Thermoflexales bacterium]MDW8054641.1 division/cell wall cluster transcriptional repressor MraZ [Anaerolineae bacterium]MDW8292975.1 division/cell wall cluster transcriptional repressor MraZ [Anaerolineae bacterium]